MRQRAEDIGGWVGFVAGWMGLLWAARIAQRAGATTEPQLVEAQVLIFVVPAAFLWSLGTLGAWLTVRPRRGLMAVVAVAALAPWLVLGVSILDVLREVCARPGGRCG